MEEDLAWAAKMVHQLIQCQWHWTSWLGQELMFWVHWSSQSSTRGLSVRWLWIPRRWTWQFRWTTSVSISLIIIMYYIHMRGSNILFFFFNFFLSLFFSNNLRVKQFWKHWLKQITNAVFLGLTGRSWLHGSDHIADWPWNPGSSEY